MVNWKPDESFLSVPEEVIREELEYVSESLVPSGDKIAGITIEKALNQFGMPDNWANIVEDYLEELEVLPADLLNESWRHIRRNSKFMPKIADFIEVVSEKYYARKIKKMKLEVMLSKINKI